MQHIKKLIALAGMIRDDEDSLICDFAETYHIYDYRSLPLRLVATLAAGLRDTSRIAMNTTEAKASTTNTILAIIADHLAAIRIGLFGEKELPSVVEALYQLDKEKDDVMAFKTGDEFMETWRAINEE